MPFIARHRDTGERIDIRIYEYPKQDIAPGIPICQACDEPLYIRGGAYYRDHFYHRVECPHAHEAHPESVEHLAAKAELVEKLSLFTPEYRGAAIDIEVRIPEAGRIADVLVTMPNGWRIAHEIQLAPISTDELQARTDSYARAGIEVVWYLGKKANTATNRIWCAETFGGSIYIEPETLASYAEMAQSRR